MTRLLALLLALLLLVTTAPMAQASQHFQPDTTTHDQMIDANTLNPSITFERVASSVPRSHHTASLLSDGQVLVAGGHTGGNGRPRLNSAEIYNPVNDTWSSTGNMNTARWTHTATTLPDGRILVAGGSVGPEWNHVTNNAELYNPSTGLWSNTGSMNAARSNHQAVLLNNGNVLVFGGINSSFRGHTSAELYNPATGTWSTTGSMSVGRFWFASVKLDDGKVMAIGGRDSLTCTRNPLTEVYNPTSGLWQNSGTLV